MNDNHYVGAYWLARQETAEACAQRAEVFFRLLTDCDPSLSQWFKKSGSMKEALAHRVDTRSEALSKAFTQQKARQPKDDFFLRLWNGGLHGGASSFTLFCGSASLRVANSCVVSLPEEGRAEERLSQAPVLARILRAMVLAWEPECGVALSHEHLDKVSESADVGTFIGWVTYLSHRRGPVPPLPSPVLVEPVEDKGTLITLSPVRFTASNPAHLEHARHVTALLSQAGLLGPLRPWDGVGPLGSLT